VLFDLQSPRRRRVIRVTFGLLAAIFAISFVFLGVGTGQGGFSFSDVFGGGDGGDAASAFDDDINAAQEKLAVNPQDTVALSQLVTLHYQAGNAGIQVDEESGQQSLTSDGKQQFEQSVDAWSKYLKASGGQPDQGPASIAYQAYFVLAQADFTEAVSATTATDQLQGLQSTIADMKGAAEAQRVIATARPNVANWSKVAEAYYLAGDAAGAQQAIDEATKLDPNAGAKLEQQLKGSQQQGERFTKAVDQLTKQQQQVQSGAGDATGGGGGGGGNPLSDLGTGGLGGTGGGF
jgi:tetratricopeptide (TPR) repeat protein